MTVVYVGHVGKVVAKLHGLIVIAVNPLAEHWHEGRLVGVAEAVAGIVEVVHGHSVVSLGGGSVLCHAHAELQC